MTCSANHSGTYHFQQGRSFAAHRGRLTDRGGGVGFSLQVRGQPGQVKRDICSHLLQRQSNTSAGQIKWPNLIHVWLGGEGGGLHGGGIGLLLLLLLIL